ncbi:MAG TPA: helix-turn-helix domain-containing protein [Candidatus Ventricola intestinavium]|nr:helix-turn-helix domain-containing protein [Candidatus Ventricola intestinavium]
MKMESLLRSPAGIPLPEAEFEIRRCLSAGACQASVPPHDFYEIHYLMEGGLVYRVEGLRYALTPGSLLLISPYTFHSPALLPEESPASERIVLRIGQALLHQLCAHVPGLLILLHVPPSRSRVLLVPSGQARVRMEAVLLALLDEHAAPLFAGMQMNQVLLTELGIRIARLLLQEEQRAPILSRDAQFSSFAPVSAYINSHLCDDLTLNALAERFYLDVNTLSRLFKRHTGLTAAGYVRKKRLEAARMHIRHGMGAAEAGTQSGFQEYSTFYRAFKAEYGITPRQFSLACRS